MSMSGETGLDGLNDTGKRVSDIAANAGRQVKKLAEEFGVPKGAEQVASAVEKRASQAYGVMRERVQARPTVAVGIAAGAGVILGLMLARRH